MIRHRVVMPLTALALLAACGAPDAGMPLGATQEPPCASPTALAGQPSPTVAAA